MCIQSSAETYIQFIMNSIGGKTLSPDIIGTATISGAKLFLMKDLKLIYIFQDKLIIKFYFKVTKRNANLPFLSVNFLSVCSEITSQIVCKFLQIIVCIWVEKGDTFIYTHKKWGQQGSNICPYISVVTFGRGKCYLN